MRSFSRKTLGLIACLGLVLALAMPAAAFPHHWHFYFNAGPRIYRYYATPPYSYYYYYPYNGYYYQPYGYYPYIYGYPNGYSFRFGGRHRDWDDFYRGHERHEWHGDRGWRGHEHGRRDR